MSKNQAHLGYRERVVQERLRIAEVMASENRTDSEAWNKVKVTKRVSITKRCALLIWDSSSRKVVARVQLETMSADTSGVKSEVQVVDSELSVKNFSLNSDPTYIGYGVFLAVDALEPVKSNTELGLDLNLLAYSAAGTEGLWPKGTYAVGLSTEL